MLETIQYQQLNEEAKNYLRTVREASGRGSPGIYIARGSKRPLLAFLAGTFILFITLTQAFAAPKEPLPTAFLQTAGVLMGGWLMLYAFRRWTASADKFGRFYYFDPDHAYIGEGETLKYAYLGNNPEVEPHGASQVRFATEDSQFYVTVPSSFVAQHIADYYSALNWVRSRTEGKWVDLPLVEAGAVAKYLAEMDEEPGGVNETGLTINDLPHEVHAEGRAKTGIASILLVALAAGVLMGGFFLFNKSMTSKRDDWAFEDAVEAKSATKYRDYLRYDKYTRHRDEATQNLATLYDEPIRKLRAVPAAPGDSELREGMIKLLDSLRGPTSPNVSLRIKQKSPDMEPTTLRTRFADGIAMELAGPHKDLITFANAPDNKKAHIEISYELNPNNRLVYWTAEIHLSPNDATPIATKKGTVAPNQNVLGGFQFQEPNQVAAPTADTSGEAVYTDVMRRIVGNAPAPPSIPIDDF